MTEPDIAIESDAQQPQTGTAASKMQRNADDSSRRKPPNAGKGRTKGVPNRVGRDLRKSIVTLLETKVGEVEGWIERVAKRNPARAADLVIRLSEFALPKLKAIELSTGPARVSRHSLFEINFDDGGPGQGEAHRGGNGDSDGDGVEVGPADLLAPALLFGAPPASLPEPNSLAAHAPLPPAAEPPRMPPPADHPTAVTIDSDSGTIWGQVSASAQPPAEARAAAFARNQELLAQRRQQHARRNEEEAEQARADARIREAKMRTAE